MSVYKIQIAPWLCQKLELKRLTYSKKQEAVEVLIKALEQYEIVFTMKKEVERTIFLNESGGELAVVVRA